MKTFFALFLMLSGMTVFSQETLVTINGIEYTDDEFIRVYQKNSKIKTLEEQKTIDDYLDLFIDYKIKIQEAQSQNLDTSNKFKVEFIKYINKLALPLLQDTVFENNYYHTIYERMKYVIDSRHILISSKKHHSPEDTLLAYEKALKIRESLLTGANFEKTARASSDDPSVHENGGHIGYTHTLKEQTEYEDAIFSLDKGEISMPVRTSKGYHIIQVLDKKKLKGDYVVAHIMLAFSDPAKSNKKELKAKADSIITALNNGASFDELAKRYSNDKRSADKGGKLPPLDILLNLPFDFKLQCWELEKKGEITQIPIETQWGFHVVKLLEIKDFAKYEDMKPRIVATIETSSSKKKMLENSFVPKLKKQFHYKLYPDAIEAFKLKIPESLIKGEWKMEDSRFSKNKYLISYADKKVSEYELAKRIEEYQLKSRLVKNIPILVDIHIEKYTETLMAKEGIEWLRKTNNEFANILEEYYDGMMLFEVTQKEVWDKANADSIGLMQFYETVKNNYMHKEKAKVVTYNCLNSEIREKLLKLLEKKSKKNYTEQEIANILNKKNTNSVAINVQEVARGENKEIDSIEWKAGAISKSGEASVLEIMEVIPSKPKELNEIKGYIVSDYQKHLEEKWIKDLRSKATISINKDTFNKIKETVN